MKKILHIFTKEYKRETKYLELQRKFISKIKLKSSSNNIDENIAQLINFGFKSNFHIAVNNF